MHLHVSFITLHLACFVQAISLFRGRPPPQQEPPPTQHLPAVFSGVGDSFGLFPPRQASYSEPPSYGQQPHYQQQPQYQPPSYNEIPTYQSGPSYIQPPPPAYSPPPPPPPPPPHIPPPHLPPSQIGSSNRLSGLFNSLFGSVGGGGNKISYDPVVGPLPHDTGRSTIAKDAIRSAILKVLQEHNHPNHYAFHPSESAKKPHPHALKLQMPGYVGVNIYDILCKVFSYCNQDAIREVMRDITLPPELHCPPYDEDIRCDKDPFHLYYRSYDGRCNNLRHPTWGQSFTPLDRWMEPVYADNVQTPRRSSYGYELPNPRFVSTIIHKTNSSENTLFNNLLMIWGQYTDHDIGFTPGFADPDTGMSPKCCSLEPNTPLHSECLPITIPPSDEYFPHINQDCIDFVRSTTAPAAGCQPGPRQQMNQITSFLDASNVYGATDEMVHEMRAYQGGQLKVLEHRFNARDYQPMLPASPDGCCTDCTCDFPDLLPSFMAGDERVNEVHTLTSMHTVFHRYHNYLADQLAAANPTWTDDQLYHETRRIVGAIAQAITYREWLPLILGPQVMAEYDLTVRPHGYTTYNPQMKPVLANVFSTVAFRFGHTLIPDSFHRITRDNVNMPITLSDMFFRVDNLHLPSENTPMGVDPVLMGSLTQACENFDTNIAVSVRDLLFQSPKHDIEGKRSSGDLMARNIMRAREHGIPGYTVLLELCGSRPINSWSDLRRLDIMTEDNIRKLTSVYKSVLDMDAFPGGLSETPIPGAVVGPTFACIIGRQFHALKYGDRFYFEHANVDNKFTEAQVENLREMSLSSVICKVTDHINTGLIYPFHQPGSNNQWINCDQLPQIRPQLFGISFGN